MKTLTKTIAGTKITLTHIEGNTFKLTAEDGKFTKGNVGVYSNSVEINSAKVNGNELIITKAEIKRAFTYLVYFNGFQFNFGGSWINENGIEIKMNDAEIDIYYYFRRPDCQILQVLNNHGELAYTELTKRPGGNLPADRFIKK